MQDLLVQDQLVLESYPLGSVHVLGALHHHLEILVDFVVLGFGARSQRVIGGVDVFSGTVGTATSVFVFLLVESLSVHVQINLPYFANRPPPLLLLPPPPPWAGPTVRAGSYSMMQMSNRPPSLKPSMTY